MATIDEICERCRDEINAVFDPGTGTRQLEIIANKLEVEECCFVRDEIRFLNNGQLIFKPKKGERQRYCEHGYAVICRKLVVIGGHKPGDFTPCKPDDPGSMYNNNNVITWQDRLHAAQSGSPVLPAKAAIGANFDPNHWQDQGQGNDGKAGGTGANGVDATTMPTPADTATGRHGVNAPKFALIALEVEIGLGDVLTIDFDGQNGGVGGVGQEGGDGGRGMGGREGHTDTDWADSCERQPGSGGAGGTGGNGGTGGKGGDGGTAGKINIVSTATNVTGGGAFISGNFVYVYDGGDGGAGGNGGFGGRAGKGGNPGFKTSECDNANTGGDGADGFPPPGFGAGSPLSQGPNGGNGGAASIAFETLPTSGSCADLLPIPIQVSGALAPAVFCRGFSTPDTGDATLLGSHFDQVASAAVTGIANVTATVKASSTDIQLDLKFDIAGNSGTGMGNLVLKRVFGADHVIANALEVKKFEVLSIAPTTGARGNSVPVTITGRCFDATAALQQVNISGAGVTAVNILVVNDTTVTCVLDIGGLASLGAQNVTVKTGSRQHTLLNAFTVTS